MENIYSSAYLDYFANIDHTLVKTGILGPTANSCHRFAMIFGPSFDRTQIDLQVIQHKSPEIYHTAHAMMGEIPLFTNLARYTLHRVLLDTHQIISHAAIETEKCIPLFFNQSIHTFRGGRWESRGPYIGFLMELLTSFEELQSSLLAQSLLKSFVRPFDICEAEAAISFLQTLKISLNFQEDEETYLPLVAENNFLRKLCCIFHTAFNTWQAAFLLIKSNSKLAPQQSYTQIAQPALSSFAALEKIQFDPQDEIYNWDHQLIQVLSSIHRFNHDLEQFHRQFRELLRPQNMYVPNITESLDRRLERALIGKGVTSTIAKKTAKALTTYCHQWGIQVRDIDSLELSKIDPNLDLQLLEDIKMVDRDHAFNLKQGRKKEVVLKRAQKVVLSIQKNLLSLTLVLIAVGLLPSCGIKTLPLSNVLDLKPEIPYKTSAKVTKDTNKSLPNSGKVERQHDN